VLVIEPHRHGQVTVVEYKGVWRFQRNQSTVLDLERSRHDAVNGDTKRLTLSIYKLKRLL